MLQKLPLKKVVAELRYKPDLGFYGKMDRIGLELGGEFPDWERSALTVEVRNKKRHRRVFISHSRCFYEADAPDPDTEFQFAADQLKKVCEGLSVDTLLRTGVRQWFAADLNKAFALMVDEIASRFLAHADELSAVLPDKTHDLAYSKIYEAPEGWKYNLRMGPMVKKE